MSYNTQTTVNNSNASDKQFTTELHEAVPKVNDTQKMENLKAQAAVGVDQAALKVKQTAGHVAENLGLKQNDHTTHLQNDPRPEEFQQPADQLAKEIHQTVPTVNNTQKAENLKAQAAVGVDQAALKVKQTKDHVAENLGLKHDQATHVKHLDNDPRPEEFQAPADQLAKEIHQTVPTVNNTQKAENLKAQAAVGVDQAALKVKQTAGHVAENLGLKQHVQATTHLQNDPRPEEFQEPADQLAKEIHKTVPTVNDTQKAENLKAAATVNANQAALDIKQNAEWVKEKTAENLEVAKEKAAETGEAAKEGLVANLNYAKDVLVANAEWAWQNVVGTAEQKKEEATVGFNNAKDEILDKIAQTAENSKTNTLPTEQNHRLEEARMNAEGTRAIADQKYESAKETAECKRQEGTKNWEQTKESVAENLENLKDRATDKLEEKRMESANQHQNEELRAKAKEMHERILADEKLL